MRKLISIGLCVLCIFTFAAFDWGGWGKPKASAPAQTEEATEEEVISEEPEMGTAAEMPEESGSLQEESETIPEVPQKFSPIPASSAPTASPTPANAAGTVRLPSAEQITAMSAAMRILGDGTPEEKQARLESLKRLAEALSAKQKVSN